MLVSVAMATYNGELFLPELLSSLAAQARPPDEVVISDDGSVDATPEIVKGFGERAPFQVRFYQQTVRLGAANNFLFAAQQCKSPVICFCDQDDVWLPQKILRCLKTLEMSRAELVIHDGLVVDEHLRPLGRRNPGLRRNQLVGPLRLDPWWVPPGYAMAFRRSIIQGLDPERRPGSHISEQMPHDQWVTFLASLHGKIALLAEPLVLYRQHATNVVGASHTSLPTAVGRARRTGQRSYMALQELAREYANYCTSALVAKTDLAAGARCRATAYYWGVAQAMAERAALYDPAANWSQRLGRLAVMSMRGRYGRRGLGRLGVRSLVKDLWLLSPRRSPFGA